jgi:hypothetical protein
VDGARGHQRAQSPRRLRPTSRERIGIVQRGGGEIPGYRSGFDQAGTPVPVIEACFRPQLIARRCPPAGGKMNAKIDAPLGLLPGGNMPPRSMNQGFRTADRPQTPSDARGRVARADANSPVRVIERKLRLRQQVEEPFFEAVDQFTCVYPPPQFVAGFVRQVVEAHPSAAIQRARKI